MKHEIIELFAQPIIKVTFDSNIIDYVIKIFENKIKDRKNIIENDNHGLIHYHNDGNVFKIYEDLFEIEKKITEASNFVYKDILNHISDLKITNAWFNECSLGSSQFMHNHCNSIISGTLYLRTDHNTYIQFDNPFGLSDTSFSIIDDPSEFPNKHGYFYHSTSSIFNVSPGDCLFWRSYIKHGYYDNKTPNRLSLSFNLFPNQVNNIYKI